MKPVKKRKRKKGGGSSSRAQPEKKTKKLTNNPIYCAIDTSDTEQAIALIEKIRPFIGGVKLGLETALGFFSEMFRVQTKKTIEGKEHYARIAKHGLFFFYLWMNPAYAQSLCSSPTPTVDPLKFEQFYKTNLPNACQELLQTKITTLQAFVEKVRTDYFTM